MVSLMLLVVAVCGRVSIVLGSSDRSRSTSSSGGGDGGSSILHPSDRSSSITTASSRRRVLSELSMVIAEEKEEEAERRNARTSATATTVDPICSDVHSHRYDPLACWLWNLKVHIPDQEVKKDLIKVVRTSVAFYFILFFLGGCPLFFSWMLIQQINGINNITTCSCNYRLSFYVSISLQNNDLLNSNLTHIFPLVSFLVAWPENSQFSLFQLYS